MDEQNQNPENQRVTIPPVQLADSPSISTVIDTPTTNITSVNDGVQYNRKHRLLLFAFPPIFIILGTILPSLFDNVIATAVSLITLELITLGCLVYGYTAQTKKIRSNLYNKKAIHQLYLPIAGIIFITAAVITGNIRGNATYGPQDYGTVFPDWLGIIYGVFVGMIIIYLSAIGNELTIATQYKNKTVLVFRKVIYVIGWVALVAISFLIYSTVYSLYNPDTE